MDALEREVSVIAERQVHAPTWPKLAGFGVAFVGAGWVLMLFMAGGARARADEAVVAQEKHEERVAGQLVQIRSDTDGRLNVIDAKVGGIYQVLIENRPREAVRADVRRAVGQLP